MTLTVNQAAASGQPTPPDPAPMRKSSVKRARQIVREEIEGLNVLSDTIDESCFDAVELIRARTGRLIVTGMGKSGLIGAKLAATFASTGTSSFFLHAAEAAHGDLGMIQPGDVVLAISNSGNSRELFAIIDYCTINAVPLISICGRRESRLGKASNLVLMLPNVREVCPNNLAPTTSATLTLVLGHVLAVLLMEARSFRDEEFAAFHPGGRLGLMLQTVERYVEEYPSETPFVAPGDGIDVVISTLAEGRKGCVVVADQDGRLCGLVTEGDLRRAYARDMFSKTASDIMTRDPTTLGIDVLMRDAVATMKKSRIANLIVVHDNRVRSVLHVKDLMQQGYA